MKKSLPIVIAVIAILIVAVAWGRLSVKQAVDTELQKVAAVKPPTPNPDLPPAPDIEGAAAKLGDKLREEKEVDQQNGRMFRLKLTAYVRAIDAGDTPKRNNTYQPYAKEIALSDPEKPITPASAREAIATAMRERMAWEDNVSSELRSNIRTEFIIKYPMLANGEYSGDDYFQTKIPTSELPHHQAFLDALAEAAGDEEKIKAVVSEQSRKD